MKTLSKRNNQMIFAAVGGLLSMTLGAHNTYAADGLIEEIKDYGFTAGAWANAGVTYNATDPSDNYNGPVTFNDRSGEFQLNQLNAYIERAVASEGNQWDVGVRFDVMFGTDAVFTQAYGALNGGWDLGLLGGDKFYNLAVPQAYAEIYAPVGNGLKVKVGHFYTPIGYEVVTAPDNFFYSHAYTMQFGEPFTHTGFLGSYTIDKNWSVMAGAVTGSNFGGWDGNFDEQLGNWAGIGGVTWTSNDEGTSLNVSGTYGPTSETNDAGFGMYSVVFKHDITEKAHMVLQHDHGYANGNAELGTTDAEWYGLNSHFYYDIQDDLKAGVRAEWFRDHNGARVCYPVRTLNCPGIAGSYYEVTAGITWKPKTWLSLRPNVRYDWAEGVDPFDAGNKGEQFLFSTDMTVTF